MSTEVASGGMPDDELRAYLLLSQAQYEEPVGFTKVLDLLPPVCLAVFREKAARNRNLDNPALIRAYDLERSLFYGLLDGCVEIPEPNVPNPLGIVTELGSEQIEQIYETYERDNSSYPYLGSMIEGYTND